VVNQVHGSVRTGGARVALAPKVRCSTCEGWERSVGVRAERTQAGAVNGNEQAQRQTSMKVTWGNGGNVRVVGNVRGMEVGQCVNGVWNVVCKRVQVVGSGVKVTNPTRTAGNPIVRST